MSNIKVKPLNIVKRNDLAPRCSHCEKDLTEVYAKTRGPGFVVGKDVLYFCPHCRTVLGFAQSRMI